MAVGSRIKMIRKNLKMTQAEFARAVFISTGYIAELERENRAASDRIIHLFSTTFGVSEHWLKTGEGKMFFKAPAEKLQRMTNLFNQLPPKFQDYVIQQMEQLLNVCEQT